jgi:hypothetical protein
MRCRNGTLFSRFCFRSTTNHFAPVSLPSISFQSRLVVSAPSWPTVSVVYTASAAYGDGNGFSCVLPRQSSHIRLTLFQIIEGAITLFLGILCYLFMPEFPEKNNFLTPKQTALVLKRVEEDRGDSLPDPLTAAKVFKYLGDWRIWAYGIMFMCSTLPACEIFC